MITDRADFRKTLASNFACYKISESLLDKRRQPMREYAQS
jgi:hypothetical protein